MGGSSPILLCHFTLFLHYLLFLLMVVHSFSSLQQQPLYHDDDSSALMHFKQSLSIIKSDFVSLDPSAYPKVASWNTSSSDCCSWDGVTCDDDTGRVIGLDLSSSFLSGFINTNSTLFRLVHLQTLNLADNYFNQSQIPADVGLLSRLTSLNLSYTEFAGQIPLEISNLTKLTSLDLSRNSLLKLVKPGLISLVQNVTDLKDLYLNQVNISSIVPHILANFSSLTSLLLEGCQLQGEFPAGIFKLPNLHFLNVQNNPNLSVYLPEFHRRSPLKKLGLGSTNFSGELPNSIGNLYSLKELDISRCTFSGSIPSSIRNLAQLVSLDLSENNFSAVSIPSWIGNLTQLERLYMRSTQLIGQIPSWLMNLTQLTSLDLSYNMLHGPIPESISQLVNLQVLSIGFNNLSGRVKPDLLLTLKNLTALQLSYNQLTLLSDSNYTNSTLPKFNDLQLESCNLTEFPNFLKTQDQLVYLNLSKNRIQGPLPTWIWNMSTQTLDTLDLSQNFITAFHQPPPLVLPWDRLWVLDFSSNMLQGSLPVPPSSTWVYNVANNRLTGLIPLLICNASLLRVLDLSHNSLSGIIPQCLGNFSNSLTLLNLRNNKLGGPIPQTYKNGTQLTMINLSENQLEGPVPRSLINCSLLESLDLGNNQINDIFPFWLGTLSELKILFLRFNRFHGAIRNPNTSFAFPKLHVLDVSHNGFTGKLPADYFQTWTAMKTIDVNQSTHIGRIERLNYLVNNYSSYTLTLINKGVQLEYLYILNSFTAIDLSSNRFEGEIPDSIWILKCLHMLNLSNNNLIGQLPSSLGNLTELESLDLSQNKFSGEIPLQLIQLNFLEIFDVSHNHLTGSIPRGKQFDTFENSSYEGNSGLCGEPLSKKCDNLEASPPTLTKFKQGGGDDDSWVSIDKSDWIVICMGYVGGLVVGLIIGHTLTARYHEWFVSTFGRNQKKQARKKNSKRRS